MGQKEFSSGKGEPLILEMEGVHTEHLFLIFLGSLTVESYRSAPRKDRVYSSV